MNLTVYALNQPFPGAMIVWFRLSIYVDGFIVCAFPIFSKLNHLALTVRVLLFLLRYSFACPKFVFFLAAVLPPNISLLFFASMVFNQFICLISSCSLPLRWPQPVSLSQLGTIYLDIGSSRERRTFCCYIRKIWESPSTLHLNSPHQTMSLPMFCTCSSQIGQKSWWWTLSSESR